MTTLVQTDTLDLAERFPDSVTADARPNYTGWMVDKEHLLEVATTIRDELGFDLLSSVTGVDYLPDKMEVVYQAYKTTGGPGIFFKVQVPRVDPIGDPLRHADLARRRFPGTRDLGPLRYQVHKSSRSAPHPDVGGLRRPSHAQGLARAVLRGR